MHVVALNVSESAFRDLSVLRKNIYEAAVYLQRESIPHFVAHPLYAQNEKLTAAHIEKLLLLFPVFEVKNGSRAARFNLFTRRLLESLTPEVIGRLSDIHRLEPYGERPWVKGMVGGSDDHGGFFVARAHTASRKGKTSAEFLASVAGRETWAEGEDGGPLTLAHSIYGIGYSFYRRRFGGAGASSPFVKALLNRFFIPGERMSLVDRIKFFVRKNMPEIYGEDYDGRSFEEILDREARKLLNDSGFMASLGGETRNRRIFAITSHLANRMIYIYTERLTRSALGGGFSGLVDSLATIGAVHLLVSPYYVAFYHQHRGKDLIGDLERSVIGGGQERKEKIALFTDTLNEINGVAITIRRLVEKAKAEGVSLTVVTSSPEPNGSKDGVVNFCCVGEVALPEYPELKLNFPPILDVIDFVEREGFTSIHVSTPGTVGLLGLLIGRLMDIPVAGTYHTEIPQYVRDLTNDDFLEKAAWDYMIWFYGGMREVMVPSAGTRRQLVEHGLAEEKVRPLPRWVDTDRFSPLLRTPRFWEIYGVGNELKLLYVGRVSKEKNLELLAKAWREVAEKRRDCRLIVVGDGPYRPEMEEALKGSGAVFTGFLEGDELCTAYASSDLFVFPSATDTFGNVVLEAQASGLPVIVSDQGGPCELMVHGETGLVVRAGDGAALTDAILKLIDDRQLLREMGFNARNHTLANGLAGGEAYSTILHPGKAVND